MLIVFFTPAEVSTPHIIASSPLDSTFSPSRRVITSSTFWMFIVAYAIASYAEMYFFSPGSPHASLCRRYAFKNSLHYASHAPTAPTFNISSFFAMNFSYRSCPTTPCW